MHTQYDQKATGVIAYKELMRVLLDSDFYALYVGKAEKPCPD